VVKGQAVFLKLRKAEALANRVRRAARDALRSRFEDEIEGWMHEPAPDPCKLAARLMTVLDEIVATV
jgi:hypothetical protein